MAVAQTVLGRNAGASLKEVASAAGVSRATVYRMFGSRALLLKALELEPDPGSREPGRWPGVWASCGRSSSK